MTTSIDQRQHNRMAVDVPVTIKSNGHPIAARCLDLSSHGIHLQAPQSFALEQQLLIEVQATKPNVVDFVVTAQVSRCTAEGLSTFNIGAKVIDIC